MLVGMHWREIGGHKDFMGKHLSKTEVTDKEVIILGQGAFFDEKQIRDLSKEL